MTVANLKKALEGVPDDTLVVMSGDGEGNDFSPLADAERTLYIADSTWSGETWSPDADEDETEDDAPEGAVPAVCLWPTN